MINPDYPTNVGNFLMHTYDGCQMPQNFQTCYYNGMGMVSMQPDSRRNEPMPNQMPMMMPQQTFSQPDMNAALKSLYQQPAYAMPPAPASEMNIKPFSSYPPEYQAPGSQSTLMDSRRFEQSNNPWANAQNQMPNPFANTVGNTQMNVPQYVNPCMECATMYGTYNAQPVQKKMQQFENMYAQSQPMTVPDINWNVPQQNSFVQSQAVYPTFQMGQPQNPNESWMNIVNSSWGK
jgi:hypothetical protein